MPEGPEVKRMGLSLASRLEGEHITEAVVLGGKWIKQPPKGIQEFQAALPARVDRVDVRGKTIHIHLDNGWIIWNTLGMSGGWKDEPTKHSHFRITTQGGRGVWFDDVRRFGNIMPMHKEEWARRLRAIGPDLLHPDTTFDEFRGALAHRSTPICKALMDQKVVAGVGNYIKAEALYRARISPHRICKTLSQQELLTLFEVTRWIMQKSLEQGGATLATYSDMDLTPGGFAFSFQVYMRTHCPLGHRVVRELTEDGRTTHWVPEVQS